jgi:hypothetical protein
MTTSYTFLTCSVAALLLSGLSACGGSGGDDDVVPTGDAIADIRLVDSDSYYPLDKLRPDGSYFSEGDTDYGTKNPKHRNGDRTTSAWAIDTTATAPNGETIVYSMSIKAVNTGNDALTSMKNNLVIDASTGMISQTCSGFPSCYDNESTADQDFEITAIAQIEGSKKKLQRKFILKVIHNN